MFQDPKQDQKPELNVEQSLQLTLQHLRDKYDVAKTPQERAQASSDFDSEKHLIASWMGDGDLRLAGFGRRAAEIVGFAEQRMAHDHSKAQLGDEAFDTQFRSNFPLAAKFQDDSNAWLAERERAAPEDAATPYAAPAPTADPATVEELMRSGSPYAGRAAGVTDLVTNGELNGGVAREGFMRSVSTTFGAAPAIEIPDEIANLPSGWNNVETTLKRTNTNQILYGNAHSRPDGSRFVTLMDRAGAPVDVDLHNLGNLTDLTFTGSDGKEHTVKMTPEKVLEIQRSREGGWFGDLAVNAVKRIWGDGPRQTPYGEMPVPSITGNDLVDEDLMKDPLWIRSIVDTPTVSDPLFHAGKVALNVAEFAAVTAITEGTASLAVKGLGGLAKIASASDYISTLPAGLRFAGRIASTGIAAGLGGARRAVAATRIPGTYYDARQIGELVWYNAVVGSVNGKWEPGEWIREGWNQGAAQMLLGGVASFSRAVADTALKTGWLGRSSLGKWYGDLDPSLGRAMENARKSAGKMTGAASEDVVRMMLKKGMLDELRAPIARQVFASLYDSAVVGLGFGMYASAHKRASQDGRDTVSASDYVAALHDSDTYGTLAGQLLGHLGGLAVKSYHSRNNEDSVPVIPGWLGVELGPDLKKQVNDISQHLAKTAMDVLRKPDHAAATAAFFDRQIETNLDFHAALQELVEERAPYATTPEPVSGGGVDALVGGFTSDRDGFSLALRYESNAGLERIYTTLSNGRPGNYPDEWNAHIRDLKDVVFDHMMRREQGEPYGSALTGQKMSDREERAIAQWKEVQKRYELERKSYDAQLSGARRDILRGVAKTQQQRALDMKTALALSRAARRDKVVGEQLSRIRAERERLEKWAAAAQAKLDEKAAAKSKRVGDLAERVALRAQLKANRRQQQALREAGWAAKREVKRQEKDDKLAIKRAKKEVRLAQEATRNKTALVPDASGFNKFRDAMFAMPLDEAIGAIGDMAEDVYENSHAIANPSAMREAWKRIKKHTDDVTSEEAGQGPFNEDALPEGYSKDDFTNDVLTIWSAREEMRSNLSGGADVATAKIAGALGNHPGYAHLAGNPAAIASLALQRHGVDPSNVQATKALAEIVVEARAARDRALAESDRTLKKPAEPGDAAPPAALEQTTTLEELWNEHVASFFNAGKEVLSPKEAGKPYEALKNAAAMGVTATLKVHLGQTPEIVQQGLDEQAALATGVMMSAGFNENAQRIAAALSGMTPAASRALIERLRVARPAIDAHVSQILDTLNEQLGVEILSQRQRENPETREALRLIASGATIQSGVSGASALGGQGRDAAISEVGVHAATVGQQFVLQSHMPLMAPDSSLTDAAVSAAMHQTEALRMAVRALPKSGIRGESLWLRLKKKIAYQATGHQNSDDIVPGTDKTVREITDLVATSISGGAVTAESRKATGVGEKTVALAKGTTAEEDTPIVKKGQKIETQQESAHDPLVLANTLISLQADAETLSTELGIRALRRADGLPVIMPGTSVPEIRRLELNVYGALLDRTVDGLPTIRAVEMWKLLKANGKSDSEITAMGETATRIRARNQSLTMKFAESHGMPPRPNGEVGPTGAAARLELEHLYRAIQLSHTGEKVDGEAKKILSNAGWLQEDGSVVPDVMGRLIDLSQEAALTALDQLHQAATEGEAQAGVIDIEEAKEGVEGMTRIGLLYSFMDTAALRQTIVIGLDFAGGYYDRRWKYAFRAKYEPISPSALSMKLVGAPVSLSAMLDKLAAKNDTGWFSRNIGFFALRALQRTVGGQARGVMTESVRRKMIVSVSAHARGRAVANRIMAIGEATMRKVQEMRLTAKQRELVGEMASFGGARDIRSQLVWTKAFGEQNAHLWPIILEINSAMARMAHAYVDNGIMSLERATELVDAYMKKAMVEIVYGEDGKPGIARPIGGPHSEQLGGFEQSRQVEQTKEHSRRIFDIAYVLPAATAEAAMRLRFWHTIKTMLDEGVHWTREEYDAAPDWDRSQGERAALPGLLRQGENGEALVATTGREQEDLGPLSSAFDLLGDSEMVQAENTKRARERERVLRERKGTGIHQAMVYEMIQRERAAHAPYSAEPEAESTVGGKPRMTAEMDRLLTTLETCYMPMNAIVELGFLIDQTELGTSVNQSQLLNVTSKLFLEWRRTKTLYSPRHWGLQNWSNTLSNHMTGKVPLWDMLDPNGVGAHSARMLGKYQKMIADGEDPYLSADPDVVLARTFMELSGGSTFVSSWAQPLDGNDLLAGWMHRLHTDLTSSGSMNETLMAAFAMKIAMAQKSLVGATRWFDAMSNSTSPEARAEALRAVHGMYGYVDNFFKFAAFLEGSRLGMSTKDAYRWAVEGTGDFQDLNPTIRAFSSTFGAMRGETYTRARMRIGKGGRVGTAAPGAGAGSRLWAATEHLRMTGIGGPFWAYNSVLTPLIGRAAVNMPWKLLSGLAASTFATMLINSWGGGDDRDRTIHAGDPDFLHLRFDAATFDAYARNYGKRPAWGVGPWTVAVRDWWMFTKAFAAQNPDRGFLFRARGPDVMGSGTEIDMTQYVSGAQQVEQAVDTYRAIRDAMATGVFPQVPRGGADDLGVFFLASQIASTIAAGLETYQGVQGKSRTRVLGEHMADAAAEWSAPMGGPLPWIFTREARAALGPLSWNGRSLGELLEGIAPAGPVGSVFGTLTGVAAKTLLPLRKMPDRSVAPRAPDRRFLSLFGASVRDPETGEALDVAAARHAATAKESALNALSWAYKNAREYGAPPGMWFAQALDIRRDLVGYEDPVAGAGVDVGDHPQTQLGKAIRNAEPNQDARRALTRTTLQMLQDHYAQIVSVADNEEGLIWRTAVPPELFDRMMAGIWNKETNAEELVRLVHREATDARARKDSGGAYDSVLARIWKQEGLNELALKMKGEAVSQMRVDMQRFVEKTTSAFPEQNQATLTAKDYTDTFGAAAWDLFPSAMNQRPKFPSLFSTAK